MRAHAPVILCSGLTYIIVNRETRLVLDDPVGEGGSVTVNRLSEDDTQKVRYSVFRRYLPMQLTSSLYRSGCSLRTEAAFGHHQEKGVTLMSQNEVYKPLIT